MRRVTSHIRNLYREVISLYSDFRWTRKNRYRINADTKILNDLTFASDGLFLRNSSDALNTERFERAYQKSLTVNDWRGLDGQADMRWRYYIVCWFADFVKSLPGQFVECGVYKGGYAMAIMDYLPFQDTGKTYYMFDTFEGLSETHMTQEELDAGLFDKYRGNYLPCLDEVRERFSDFPVRITPGTVPESLQSCDVDQVCYLSIDMNCVTPEIAAAEFFWDKLVPGAVILLDDYGFPGHEAQKTAFDDFAASKQAPLLSLPTGQAVIFRK